MDDKANPPAGWYPDPYDNGGERYWDGANWTQQTRSLATAPPPEAPPSFSATSSGSSNSSNNSEASDAKSNLRQETSNQSKPRQAKRSLFQERDQERRERNKDKSFLQQSGWKKEDGKLTKLAKITLGALGFVVFILIISSLGGGEEEKERGQTENSVNQTKPTEQAPTGSFARLREETRFMVKKLSGIHETKVRSITKDKDTDGRFITVTLNTPAGGLNGASTTDMNYVSAEVYRAAFGLSRWKKDPVYIIFKGGLVSTKTGKPLPQVTTGVYVLTPKQAKAINWKKLNVVRYTINWSLYRTVLSPAIKNDD